MKSEKVYVNFVSKKYRPECIVLIKPHIHGKENCNEYNLKNAFDPLEMNNNYYATAIYVQFSLAILKHDALNTRKGEVSATIAILTVFFIENSPILAALIAANVTT